MGEPSVTDILTRAVHDARESRKLVEGELHSVPRWRFRRRAELAGRLERRRRYEQELLELERSD